MQVERQQLESLRAKATEEGLQQKQLSQQAAEEAQAAAQDALALREALSETEGRLALAVAGRREADAESEALRAAMASLGRGRAAEQDSAGHRPGAGIPGHRGGRGGEAPCTLCQPMIDELVRRLEALSSVRRHAGPCSCLSGLPP